MIKFIFGIIGMFIGSAVTVIVMSLLAMAKDTDPPKREPEQKEPTTMWMVGNLCKFEGNVYEIKSFMEINGHTYARLSHNDNAGLILSLPVEELEAVEE